MCRVSVLLLGLALLAGCGDLGGYPASYGGHGAAGFYSPVCPQGTFSYGPYRARRSYGYRTYYYCHPYIPEGRTNLTLLIRGERIAGTKLQFSGTGIQYGDGRGTIDFYNLDDTDCSGGFVYTTWLDAEGTIACSDGRSGTFYFSSDTFKGTGAVSFGSRLFKFTLVLV
jgi:hypothetical protein